VTSVTDTSSGREFAMSASYARPPEKEKMAKVRQTCTDATRRRTLLKFPRVLAIIGSERQRRACAIRLIAICETICPGPWSSAWTETLSEVRDGALENVSDLHSEAVPLELSEAETQWAAGLRGCQAMRCAAVAAQCEMQLAGRCL